MTYSVVDLLSVKKTVQSCRGTVVSKFDVMHRESVRDYTGYFDIAFVFLVRSLF